MAYNVFGGALNLAQSINPKKVHRQGQRCATDECNSATEHWLTWQLEMYLFDWHQKTHT